MVYSFRPIVDVEGENECDAVVLSSVRLHGLRMYTTSEEHTLKLDLLGKKIVLRFFQNIVQP